VTLIAPPPRAASDPPDDDEPELPRARGPLTERLLDHLTRPVHELAPWPEPQDDLLTGDDAPLALYLCYELHYRGLPEVDEAWEWEPTLLRERRRLERALEQRVGELVGPAPLGLSADATVEQLRALAAPGDGRSLSAYVEREATLEQARELAIHRSAYQLKEADPHTWGIPRLAGRAKAALADIQHGEYGEGRPERVHATMFATTMRHLGLDPRYGAYLDDLPGITLSTTNLMSLFGLHRQWRGALVGHLALFEMCSVGPMGRYARGMRRLGLPDDACAFYDEHVIADERHQVVAIDELVRGLLEDEPVLGGEVVHGAQALTAVEGLFTAHVLDAWGDGRSSLRHR
jgi:hypothetical protein